jgi:hypothetical protein
MARTETPQAPDGYSQIATKTLAQVAIAVISLLAAGAGSIGYLVIDRLFNDDSGPDTFDFRQYEQRFDALDKRVLERCRTNREAVELQLDGLQLQIDSLAGHIAEIKASDAEIERELRTHIADFQQHIKWGRERITAEDLEMTELKTDIEKRLTRNEQRINEIYRILNRYIGNRYSKTASND